MTPDKLQIPNDSYATGQATFSRNIAVQSATATSTFSTGGLTIGTSQFMVRQTSGNVYGGKVRVRTQVTVDNSARRMWYTDIPCYESR